MTDTSRARRRAQARRMKARVRRILRRWHGGRFQEDPRNLGVMASTHGRPCGCFMCQEPGRNVPQPRERAFDYIEMPDADRV